MIAFYTALHEQKENYLLLETGKRPLLPLLPHGIHIFCNSSGSNAAHYQFMADHFVPFTAFWPCTVAD